MTLRLFYLNLKLVNVFIKTTDYANNESTIYGKFEESGKGAVVKPLQVVNYIDDDFSTIPEAIEAFRYWDNKKGKTYSEINVILEGRKACETSQYSHIIKNLLNQIEELENYIQAENHVNKVLPINKYTLRITQLRETITKLEEAVTILSEEI